MKYLEFYWERRWCRVSHQSYDSPIGYGFKVGVPLISHGNGVLGKDSPKLFKLGGLNEGLIGLRKGNKALSSFT